MSERTFSLTSALRSWWKDQREQTSAPAAYRRLLAIAWEFGRDSLPDRRRQRYGDIDYDWEHRVNTTGATVSWRARLLGLLNSPYQPIPTEQFREMMSALAVHLHDAADFSQYTFIDIGSGKGRALLLASEYGFRRIVGVELLPELDRISRENVRAFGNPGVNAEIELLCMDASRFTFPAEPSVIFLFNPLTEPALRILLANLERSVGQSPRPLYLVYANPILERTIADSPLLTKLGGTHQYSLFGGFGRRVGLGL